MRENQTNRRTGGQILIDQLALRDAPHAKDKPHAEGQAVKDRRQREADQGRGERPAENNDHGMVTEEHAQAAAHEHDSHDDRGAGEKAETRCNIHETAPNPRRQALGNAPIGTVIALKGGLLIGTIG